MKHALQKARIVQAGTAMLCCSFWTRVLRRWPGTDANEACAEFAISFYQKRKEECLHLQSPNLVQAPPDRRFREAPPA